MNKWFKSLSTTLLAVILLFGVTACDDTTVRSPSYGSSYYQPYDYYYYPQSRIYLNISTGYYFYPYKNRWRKVRSLPRSYHLDRRDRVKIRIKSKDRPYARHSEHRKKYVPRRYNRDQRYYRDKNKYKNRTKVKVKSTYDYYYYPGSRVYYNAKSGYYYYPGRKSWKRTKRVPKNYRLNHKERVKVKVKSRDKPYLNHSVHRARYVPRNNYNKNKVIKRSVFNRKVKDYEKGGM
ncbi:hypothetical protein GCM10009133_13410 [Cocleimonas flava]|uniref:Lipoprotein n=1 Tax=Cocleimonas flava TaxID=634765 RepID=A0A4R1F6X3_9GAMM|nr:hypothetical protein [Cocleimonas flava]TCJ87708.1 hypothetical protein EV695_2221 [Cocleimonas flava]